MFGFIDSLCKCSALLSHLSVLLSNMVCFSPSHRIFIWSELNIVRKGSHMSDLTKGEEEASLHEKAKAGKSP